MAVPQSSANGPLIVPSDGPQIDDSAHAPRASKMVDAATGKGKGLSWEERENIALARSAAAVCSDPATGSGMTSAEMGRRIRSHLLNDKARPDDACTTRDKGLLDSRRWDGRSAAACHKQWDNLRRECTRFKGSLQRVKNMQLTGNPTDDDLFRCASLLFSDGSKAVSHLYDCIRNPDYHISKPFKHAKTFLFLDSHSTLLDAGGIMEEDRKRASRPIGTKKAKEMKSEGGSTKMQDPGTSAADGVRRIEKMLAESSASKLTLSAKKLQFQRERMEWEMAKTLIGPGSNASSEERDMLSTLLRKRLIASLSTGCSEVQTELGEIESEVQNVSEATQALLEFSSASTVDKTNSHKPSHSMSVSGRSYLNQTPSSYVRAVKRSKTGFQPSNSP